MISDMEQGQILSILVDSDPGRGKSPLISLLRKGENGRMAGSFNCTFESTIQT